jgi:hypothetical protein
MESVKTKEVDQNVATTEFVKDSFNAVLTLHEEILASKEVILNRLLEENKFLKELIISIQEINSEDRETIEILTQQIYSLQEELEFTKRKYKLMWNQAVENYRK